MADKHSEVSEMGSESTVIGRRSMLKATGATAVAATGLAATAGSASAQWGSSIEVIEVEDGGGWFGSGGWSADGELPVVDELFVFIHGWFGNTTVSSQASDVLGAMEDGGYSADAAAAIQWPATTINFFGAQSDTEDVGDVTAGLIEDFKDAGGGNVRLVGHSLGGRCVLWTAAKIGSGYTIDTVAPLGAAADGSEACDSPWNSGLSNAGVVRNYHSENDSTVGGAYGGISDTALGNEGAGCDPATNYVDVDVTDTVGSHFTFLGDSTVGENLANNLDSTEEGETGSGGGGWFGWF